MGSALVAPKTPPSRGGAERLPRASESEPVVSHQQEVIMRERVKLNGVDPEWNRDYRHGSTWSIDSRRFIKRHISRSYRRAAKQDIAIQIEETLQWVS